MDTPRRRPELDTLRASDQDREKVAALLRDSYSEGRLTVDEFEDRLSRAYASKTLGDLVALTGDLPGARPIFAPPAAPRRPYLARVAMTYLVLSLFLIAIWAVSGVHSGAHHAFWPIWPILIFGFILAMRAVNGGRSRAYRSRSRRRGPPENPR